MGSVNPRHMPSVQQAQPVGHGMGPDSLAVQPEVGYHSPFSHSGFPQDKAVFQVSAGADFRPPPHIRLVGRIDGVLRRVGNHLFFPSQKFIAPNLLRHQGKQFPRSPKVDKFRRGQADKL